MPFLPTYKEIEEMVRRKVLTSRMARSIARKADISLAGSASAPGSQITGAPILSIPPVSPVGGCPKRPYADDLFSSHQDRMDFYADAKAAEGGEQTDLDRIRTFWLTNYLGMESEIVMDCVMPLLGYDYTDEVCTITLLQENGCSVEIDITPPDNGFWEQYKTGDARFEDQGGFPSDYQNCKWLARSIDMSTAETGNGFGGGVVEAELDEFGDPPAGACPEPGSITGYSTHRADVLSSVNPQVRTHDPLSSFRAEGWLVNYDEDGIPTSGTFPTTPYMGVSADISLDTVIEPFYPGGPGVENPPGIGSAFTGGALAPFGVWNNWGHFVRNGGAQDAGFQLPYYVAHRWRVCTAAEVTFDYEQDCFPVLYHPALAIPPGFDNTTTYRQARVYKEGYDFTQNVDWSIQPTGTSLGRSVLRYTQSFEVFDVVAVRVIGAGPSTPV